MMWRRGPRVMANKNEFNRSEGAPGRSRPWLPVMGVAASIVAFIIIQRTLNPSSVADFDMAIDAYDRFAKGFEANVPSQTLAQVSAAYRVHGMQTSCGILRQAVIV